MEKNRKELIKNIYDLQYLYFEIDSIKGTELEEKYNKLKSKLDDWTEEFDIEIKKTNYNIESIIMNENLFKGVYDKNALAWKAGRIKYINGQMDFSCFEKIEDDKINYFNGCGNPILETEFIKYNEHINRVKDSICEIVNNDSSKEKWKKIYELAIKEAEIPKNFGPVNIINALFFITKGKAPIYDQFVHKAIRAIASDISPREVDLEANPSKQDVEKVFDMYYGYILLLEKVYPEECQNNKDMFISRELDRALWVYGHAKK